MSRRVWRAVEPFGVTSRADESVGRASRVVAARLADPRCGVFSVAVLVEASDTGAAKAGVGAGRRFSVA